MIATKIILITLKTIYLIVSIVATLYCIDFAIQEKQSRYRYNTNGWIAISVFWILALPFIFMMVFSSSPYWNWIKSLSAFFPILPIVMVASDPHDIFEENYPTNKLVFSIIPTITIFVPWILLGIFEINCRLYFKDLIIKDKSEFAKISMYRDCNETNDPSHFHIKYYNKDNYIKSMKVYPGNLYNNESEIDPTELSKDDATPIIITPDRNEIKYYYQQKNGEIEGPIILYCTQHYYDTFIKKVMK